MEASRQDLLADLRVARTLVTQINRTAQAIRKDGRLAVVKPSYVSNGVKYYSGKKTRKICCLAKSTFWYYRKAGKFPAPDYQYSSVDKFWNEQTITLWMMERLQAGYTIEPFAFQHSWATRKAITE